MDISRDAIIFGLGRLNSPKASLAFGGEGAEYEITDRARAALNELLAAGYAEPAEPDDSRAGREFYRGTSAEPSLGELASGLRIDPFRPAEGDDFVTFARRKSDGPEP